MTGTGLALPGAIQDRVHHFELSLRVEYGVGEGDAVGRFLVSQAALAMARMEVAPAVEWEQRREQVERAEHCWEIDRVLEAEELGERLARRPAVVSAMLLQSAQGCEWLMQRWALLAGAIEAAGAFEDAHRRLMADLLGIPAALREADPRLSPDRPAAELAAMAREEAAAAFRLKVEILDARDDRARERACAGLEFDESPAARRLRGYEAACDRRLRWATEQLRRRHSTAAASPSRPPSSSLDWTTAPEPTAAPLSRPADPPAGTPRCPAPAAPSTAAPAGVPASKTNPTAPDRLGRAVPGPAAPASHDPDRPPADRVEKRTQPAPGSRSTAPAERPVFLNRRDRRAAAARARRAG